MLIYRCRYDPRDDDSTVVYNLKHYLYQDWRSSNYIMKENLLTAINQPATKLWNPMARVVNKLVGILNRVEYKRSYQFNEFCLICRHTREATKMFIKSRCVFGVYGRKSPNLDNSPGYIPWHQDWEDRPVSNQRTHIMSAVNSKYIVNIAFY